MWAQLLPCIISLTDPDALCLMQGQTLAQADPHFQKVRGKNAETQEVTGLTDEYSAAIFAPIPQPVSPSSAATTDLSTLCTVGKDNGLSVIIINSVLLENVACE